MPKSLHFEMFEKFVFWGHPVLAHKNKSELESPHHIYIMTMMMQIIEDSH